MPIEQRQKVVRLVVRQVIVGEDNVTATQSPRQPTIGHPVPYCVAQPSRSDREHKPGERGLILPASTSPGHPQENALLPDTVADLKRLGISPREVALDGAFMPGPTNGALADLTPKTMFIAGLQEPGSKRTKRRLARYRTGEEGRISHLKRRSSRTAPA